MKGEGVGWWERRERGEKVGEPGISLGYSTILEQWR